MAKPLVEKERKLILRAVRYPYDLPKRSYVYVDGNAFEIEKVNFDEFGESIVVVGSNNVRLADVLNTDFDISETCPVLAYGSNASVEQLRHKFLSFKNVVIPVIKADLYDFDVVYSAHFSPYGSIPATLQYSPRTVVKTFVAYLNERLLKHMHKTESIGINYYFCKLRRIKVSLDGGLTLEEVFVYLSINGCLLINETPVALSSIKAENRIFPEMTEWEILDVVRRLIAADRDFDTFVLENVMNEKIRKDRTEKLKKLAEKFNYDHYEIIDGSC
ncbi:hypothetical protein [Ferroglobus sp.]|uniref:hypothetical protein n=1 Tax=Ferroglobus sp. TaxID=2614230 RepID=UPI0025BD9703|nr:hypothetical protein [Ferroglobus sp.]